MNTTLAPEALVLGADGEVASGVIGALLEAGSPVLGVGCDGPRLQALADHYSDEPGLELIRRRCPSNDRAAEKLVARLRRRRRPLRAVFASLDSALEYGRLEDGGLEAGRLLDRPAEFLRARLESGLVPHLAAARHLVPLLARYDGTAHYVLIGGPLAQRGWAGYGHASITAAALRMLANVLHGEAQALGVRVQLLTVEQPLCTAGNERNACAQWPRALAIGRHAVSLLTDDERPRALVPFDPARALLPARPLFPEFSLPFAPKEIQP